MLIFEQETILQLTSSLSVTTFDEYLDSILGGIKDCE